MSDNLARQGRLEARPRVHGVDAPRRGAVPLGLGGRRDGFVYVPTGYRAKVPTPLVVMLHGAGGHASHALGILQANAEAEGFILLAPESQGSTWDVILGAYGPDVSFIDLALAWVFERYAVDPTRIALAGFSDGASYALSLGISNGDLFTHLLAFSPGFANPAEQHGEPELYVSHGARDAVLPIDVCSRHLVPRLKAVGYEVLYREFDGPHVVPAEITREASEWFMTGPRTPTRSR